MMTLLSPKIIFVFSGKRKSGKDFISEKLQSALGHKLCGLVRLSGPLKQQYALENGLDYKQLLSSGQYKEKYREDMIKWGEARRNSDPGYFCQLACLPSSDKPVWIVTDARRPSDVQYFKKINTNVILVRITASLDVRRSRGWEFAKDVDDSESECALDNNVSWDFIIINDNDECDNLNRDIQKLTELAIESINQCNS